jgi:hypothetical protein
VGEVDKFVRASPARFAAVTPGPAPGCATTAARGASLCDAAVGALCAAHGVRTARDPADGALSVPVPIDRRAFTVCDRKELFLASRVEPFLLPPAAPSAARYEIVSGGAAGRWAARAAAGAFSRSGELAGRAGGHVFAGPGHYAASLARVVTRSMRFSNFAPLTMRRKSTCVGRSLTGLNATSFGIVICFLPPSSISTTLFEKWPVINNLMSAFSSTWMSSGSCLLP